jgi:uncharacterized protein (TIGR02596 family)
MKIVPRFFRSAFSLIELMVVLGVVGLLLAFAAPNLLSLISANSLTGEGQVLRNQFTYAQQIAISKSADVEVRFFKMPDFVNARPDEAFRAFQLFQYNVNGELAPISPFFRIRSPVAVHEGLSTLLDVRANGASAQEKRFGFSAPTQGMAEAPAGEGGRLQSTQYVAFRFRPDGSTDLPFRTASQDTWYITLVQGDGAIQSSRPDNYLCLQVNPYNGQVSEFRP